MEMGTGNKDLRGKFIT